MKRRYFNFAAFALPIVVTLAALAVFTLPARSSDAAAGAAPRTDDEQHVIDAYKRANRAVVNISTRAEAFDFFGATAQEGSGSGIVIDARRGYVLTNFHVVEGAQQIAVTLADGHSYPGKLVGADADTEVALLQIDGGPQDLTTIPFGDSSQLEVGQRVIAIGNPFGLNRTLTQGVISSLERSIRSQNGRVIEDAIQTDAPINPGNSGGPLLDTAGRLVGLNTAILSRTGENAGIGFAIPVNTINRVLPQLFKFGKVLRPKIGVVIADTEFGPALLYVQAGSPAEDVGLQGARHEVRQGPFVGYIVDFSRADFVLSVNGQPVRSKTEVLDFLAKAEPNSAIELEVRRGYGRGKTRVVKVKPVLG